MYYKVPEWLGHPRASRVPDEVWRELDFGTDMPLTERAAQLHGEPLFLAHSRPAVYIEEAHVFRMIDLCAVAPSAAEARAVLLHTTERGEAHRTTLSTWCREKVVPVLAALEGVLAIQGRGTVYDRQRVVGSGSFPNLMLFVDGARPRRRVLEDLAALKFEGNLEITNYRVQEDYFEAVAFPITRRFGRENFGVDILDLEAMQRLIALYPHALDPYFQRAFEIGPILFDPRGRLEGFHRMVRLALASPFDLHH